MTQETSFHRWRKQQGLTQEEAAAALGVSKSQVANWDTGVNRSRGNPAAPPYAIRCLMTNIAMDSKPTPWPE
jgi:transcriptional regulator with XRE-family HTH domain